MMKVRLAISTTLMMAIAVCWLVPFTCILLYGTHTVQEPSNMILALELLFFLAIIAYGVYCIVYLVRSGKSELSSPEHCGFRQPKRQTYREETFESGPAKGGNQVKAVQMYMASWVLAGVLDRTLDKRMLGPVFKTTEGVDTGKEGKGCQVRDRIRKVLDMTSLPVEPLVYTEAEFEEMKDRPFLQEVLLTAREL
jgi:hypothetical protein